ncbi:MAG TPA: Gfo/Idh/MocA family oxidoreductase [Rectinemataceae bacterium]|nr:Gfo/Idh/MocA family oxidoreductase [Rectinemataceae bacterium]
MALKIGIVGAGGMARYHIAGFRSAGAEVLALADPSKAARERSAAAFAVAETYDGLDAMLAARKDLDAVSIITPNKFHAPVAIQALKAGKHVYCEKPPALNAAEVEAMAAAAKAAGRHLQFGFNNRARPETRALMDYVRAGEVGRINSAQAVWARRSGIPGFGGWFTTKALSGGGPVIDLLHMLDLALYFMDFPEPAYVLAQTFRDFMEDRRFKGPWGIPDVAGGATDVESACHGFVSFKGGQVLYLRSSWAEMTERELVSMSFQGAKAGGLVERSFGRDGLDETSADRCELYTVEHGAQVNRRILVPFDETMGRHGAAANFVAAVEGREAPLNTPEQAVRLMRIVDAIYASAAKAEPVKP